MIKLPTLILLLLTTWLLAACGDNKLPLIEATIIGSTHTPDPILQEVRELEQKGVIKDVIVMESFPVQIRLNGPKEVIERLKSKSAELAQQRTPAR